MKALIEKGHEVTVITGLPNYPKGKNIEGYQPGTTKIDGVNVVRLSVRPRKKGTKNLFLNYLSYVISASNYTKNLKQDFDAIYVYQLSPVFMAIPAILLKKKIKKPILLYCLDLWPESLVSGGVKKDSLVYKVVRVISKKIYKSIDLIEISSKSFEKYFKDSLKINGEFSYNPQYAVDDIISNDESDIVFPKDKINITFTGNIGEMQGLDIAIKAMQHLDNNVLLHIVGDGSKKESLEVLTKQLNIEHKVKFHGRKPINQMSTVMEHSDALLVIMKDDEVISYTLPAKVQSYLKSGKFIFGAINGEAANVIKESGVGLVSPAENDVLLAENINKFVNNKDELSTNGKNGINYYYDNFGKEKFIEILESDLNKIIMK